MRKSEFMEIRIVATLEGGESCMPVAEPGREHGSGSPIRRAWKRVAASLPGRP